MLTSPPISRIFISFSISMTCCSSAQARAHGTPSTRAEVATTHNALPLKLKTDLTVSEVAVAALAKEARVWGGMMSRSAYRRSATDSPVGS